MLEDVLSSSVCGGQLVADGTQVLTIRCLHNGVCVL